MTVCEIENFVWISDIIRPAIRPPRPASAHRFARAVVRQPGGSLRSAAHCNARSRSRAGASPRRARRWVTKARTRMTAAAVSLKSCHATSLITVHGLYGLWRRTLPCGQVVVTATGCVRPCLLRLCGHSGNHAVSRFCGLVVVRRSDLGWSSGIAIQRSGL